MSKYFDESASTTSVQPRPLCGGVAGDGALDIGNETLTASTAVSATSLGNNQVTVQGEAASGAAKQGFP